MTEDDKPNPDVLKYLYDRYIGDDPVRQAEYETAKAECEIVRLRYDKAVLLRAVRKMLRDMKYREATYARNLITDKEIAALKRAVDEVTGRLEL